IRLFAWPFPPINFAERIDRSAGTIHAGLREELWLFRRRKMTAANRKSIRQIGISTCRPLPEHKGLPFRGSGTDATESFHKPVPATSVLASRRRCTCLSSCHLSCDEPARIPVERARLRPNGETSPLRLLR